MGEKNRRVDLRHILTTPTLRRELFIGVIVVTQAREGITTTRAQAAEAYDRVQREKGETPS